MAELLRELGPRLRLGGLPAEALGRCPTGIPELDRLLGGGLPRGRLTEIAGPGPSCGRTSLALALLAQATRAGELVAVADGADAFDPASAQAAGVVLGRVLWMRARQPREALRGAARLLEARGFAVVLLDLGAPAPRVAATSWLRLAQAAAATSTALVVLSLARAAGAAAELALELAPLRACFTGTPALLEASDAEIALVRRRAGPAARPVSVRLHGQPAA
ncbi:MAG TPA: ATPase domain-containing protein [Myxococcota bacterium]